MSSKGTRKHGLICVTEGLLRKVEGWIWEVRRAQMVFQTLLAGFAGLEFLNRRLMSCLLFRSIFSLRRDTDDEY